MSPLRAMKLALLPLPFVLSAACTQSIVQRQLPVDQPFTLIAVHSTSPIHLQPINANNLTFWIGKPTTSLCPMDNTTQCPAGNITALHWGGYSMDTNVGGGQAVFIASDGALGFSGAHQVYYPDGATAGPFNATFDTIGGVLGQFTFTGNGSTGWLACPIGAEGPWQVFAGIEGLKDGDVPGGCVDDCIGFDALTIKYNSTKAAAFQYE